MRGLLKVHIALAFLLFGAWFTANAQEGFAEENIFRLVQADEARQMTQYNMSYRIVRGNARFLHNDAYLLCDSASWNVDGKMIEAFGNVQIIQDNTVLHSEQLIYFIDRNLAKFRGGVVELIDRDGNTLRTEMLEYNTKDSVATFDYGGAVKDTSGNVIEGRKGTYDSKTRAFTFVDNVEIYMDSIEIKTESMVYLTDYQKALFGRNTYLWRGAGFLKSNSGSYERETTLSYFADDVYMNDPQYEAWSDEVYYNQTTGRAEMLNNSQILDTTHKAFYLADHLIYNPAPEDTVNKWTEEISLVKNPVIVYCGENENHQPDTLYMGSDTLYLRTKPHNLIPQQEFDDAKKRVEDMEFDAIAKMREEQAAERESKRVQALRDAGKLPPEGIGKKNDTAQDSTAAPIDSLAAPVDSLGASVDSLAAPADSLAAPADSLAAPADSLAVPLDTTPVRHIFAYGNAKVYRSDIQAVCDSMLFTEIDSVARLYGKPALWNAVKNQITGETIHILMKNGNLYRGNVITDSWVISQEDSIHFHQIRSTEMLGYFYENQLYRFDALGGVSAVFYLIENEVATTINLKESKMMTTLIKDGNARRLLYLEDIKSDAYPISELVIEKQRLKGFKWRGDERPASKESILTKSLKSTDREQYGTVRRPRFREVNKYFDNFMFGKSVGAEFQIQDKPETSVSGEILEMRP